MKRSVCLMTVNDFNDYIRTGYHSRLDGQFSLGFSNFYGLYTPVFGPILRTVSLL